MQEVFQLRGDYLRRQGDYTNAKNELAKARTISVQEGDSCLLAENTRTFAMLAINENDHKSAPPLIKKAISLLSFCDKGQDYFVKMQRYLNDLGVAYNMLNNIDSALSYFLKAQKFVTANKDLYKSDSIFYLSALSLITANIAYNYSLKKEFALSKKYDDTSIVFYKKMLQYKKPVQNDTSTQQHYHELNDSLKDVAITSIHNGSRLEFARLDKRYQVELLKKDNRIKQDKITGGIIGGLLMLFAIIVSMVLLRRLRNAIQKRDKLNNELKKTMQEKEIAEQELRERQLFSQEMSLQMEFQAAILDQRRQISDDMHDELSSSLAALKYYVTDMRNRMRGTDAEKMLTEITAEVSTIYISARNYMHGLKTNDWQTRFSLTGFLNDIQQKFSQKMLMEVKLELDEEGIRHKLNTYQHDQLYHIVKECIANVIKHANAATVVEVIVSFGNNSCHYMVADNGKGFERGKVHYGIGLQSIQKRIKEMDGHTDIISSATGTIVTGSFPIG